MLLQNQDANMIQILKKRLESSMQSELEAQQREQQQRTRLGQLERQLLAGDDQVLQNEVCVFRDKVLLFYRNVCSFLPRHIFETDCCSS